MQLWNMPACCSMKELGSLPDSINWMEDTANKEANICATILHSGTKAVICNVRRKHNPQEVTYNSVIEFFNSRISAASGLRATPLFTYVGNYSDDVTCFRLEIIK